MANSKERIDALEVLIADMLRSNHHAPGILKEFSLRLDALEEDLEATDNARNADSMDWESKFRELQDRMELLYWAVVNTPAGKALLECKHTGTVREYCQAFSALILDISDMSVVDRLFFFMEGLKPWACTELNRCRVNNLNEAINAAESLSDYNSEQQRPPQRGNPSRTNGGKKPGGQVGNPEEHLSGEKPKDTLLKKKGDVLGKGLMYVDIKVNEKAIRTMVDTGATHKYISSIEVERLGLTLEKGCGWVKAINSVAQPVAGIARSVLIKVGPYEGRTNISVVTMDNFKLILGLEFLRDTHTTLMPCTNSFLSMLGSKPCVIPTISPRAGECSISALHLNKGVKWDETTYLSMLWWDEIEELSGPLPRVVKVILNNFEDYWDMPQDIVSDRDSHFTGNFWTELFKLFGTQHSMKSSYHLKLDGQMERFNYMLEKYLHHYVNATQIKWVKLLDVAQLCFDSRKSSSKGKSAFEIVNGQQPLLPHTMNIPNTGKSPRAHKLQ
ncbi:hypothetical protein RJ639_001538 [Escallonia herrerae]|uniref:Integrase catalytic domain-containing protein n=1 Tax=Escallonia herrerae TaxID=1293975 RepID=A0AA88XM53_9ASTE|nr:hypothetical protein RJ639_001538 [Escallonia herrerae]